MEVASGTGHNEIVKLILEKGFETRSNRYPTLWFACQRGYNSIVETLGGQEEIISPDSLRNGIAELLVAYGVKKALQNDDATEDMLCVSDHNIVEILVDMNRETNIEALVNAAAAGRDEIIKVLIMETAGVDIGLLGLSHGMETLLAAPKDARGKIIDTLISSMNCAPPHSTMDAYALPTHPRQDSVSQFLY